MLHNSRPPHLAHPPHPQHFLNNLCSVHDFQNLVSREHYMATEVYHLARENRKKVGCHMRKKVKALPGDQGKKRKKEKGGGGQRVEIE